MQTTMLKSGIVAIVSLALSPNPFSILLSLAGILYFLSMLKMKVIDVKYKRSWEGFFKSILTHIKTHIIMKISFRKIYLGSPKFTY